MKKLIFLLCASALILSSCGSGMGDFEITSYNVDKVEDLKFGFGSASTKAYLTVNYNNPSSRSFTVETLKGRVCLPSSDNTIATITMPADTTLSVLKKSSGSVTIPLKIKISNPLFLFSQSLTSDESIFKKAVLNIDATVKSGYFSKKISKNGIPLEGIVDKFFKAQENEN